MRKQLAYWLLIAACSTLVQAAPQWKPAEGPLKTRWAADVSPSKVHPEYPRPQMVRKAWLNLNGLWDLAVAPEASGRPELFNKQILVPFPIESALSGVKQTVSEKERIWYRRSFALPRSWLGKRVMLNFGPVDFDTTVYVNGREVGKHRGGYDAFSFDITSTLLPAGPNEIMVSVWDPTDAGTQPRGKQIRNPHGIWYTPTSGIWQTVWLEPVSSAYIQDLEIIPDIDKGIVRVQAATGTLLGDYRVEVTVQDRGSKVGSVAVQPGKPAEISIPKAKLWSPERPYLYDLTVSLKLGSRRIDQVKSYFGMRKISLGKDAKGFTRVMLNNQPYFQFGPLDQGFWPDGLYTAPTDEALRYDIIMTKKLGFNMARKHVKVEPARWYYWCDKLGLLVWQDMPSGDKYISGSQPDITRTPESGQQYEKELTALVRGLKNHPSIVIWVPFNEGWGQWDTGRITDMVKKLDPNRLVISTSGWTDRGTGDINDMHKYPGPGAPEPEQRRAIVLGEFGGLGLPIRGHTWQSEKNWGYRSFTDKEKLQSAYINLIAKLYPLIDEKGLSAAVYTQTTDVEVEVNGLMTYDREILKVDLKKIAPINRGELSSIPRVIDLLPSAQTERSNWRYTTEKPSEDWFNPSFDASSWKTGAAGFGLRGTPGGTVRTEWRSDNIWLRREFNLPSTSGEILLNLHHDDDATVYINGVLAAQVDGATSDYEHVPLSGDARASLKPSGNVIAVHCRQTGGDQYIDAGLIRIQPVVDK